MQAELNLCFYPQNPWTPIFTGLSDRFFQYWNKPQKILQDGSRFLAGLYYRHLKMAYAIPHLFVCEQFNPSQPFAFMSFFFFFFLQNPVL